MGHCMEILESFLNDRQTSDWVLTGHEIWCKVMIDWDSLIYDDPQQWLSLLLNFQFQWNPFDDRFQRFWKRKTKLIALNGVLIITPVGSIKLRLINKKRTDCIAIDWDEKMFLQRVEDNLKFLRFGIRIFKFNWQNFINE